MPKKVLPKAYEAMKYEKKIYQIWEKSGFFNPDKLKVTKNAQPFSIMMPPPNVTGVLHLGHALENSLMDIEIRYQRMLGKKALLLPGTDHAAVATQAKVEKELIKQGIANPREKYGRAGLLKLVRKYAEESKKTILKQIRTMGTSCDWSRLAYTFDEERSTAVDEVFVRMYQDGLIYRGYRVVNWSVKGQSTCSDDELVHEERKTKLYTFKYSADFPISIATTRPETKLGDTAVAVNPEDKRYKKYIGKTFTVDVGAQKPLVIRIIGDQEVDPDFGTGAVGVTPAHSQVDFDMYLRHQLDLIPVIGADGKMTEAAGEKYQGLAIEQAREKFVEYLRANDLLTKEEDIVHNVGTSDRFSDIVEVIPMEQWFIDVNKKIPKCNKSLKDLMREAVITGHGGKKNKKITIVPERFDAQYLHWIDNLRDWCISRQIWWGHQIPVWYRNKETYVGTTPPQGKGWQQDPDTLDTWFSSGLWTFSTLGWPKKTSDLKTFHPTSWMQMGYEILFFWMARMILMSTYALDDIPFKEVYIHGILRDKQGRKFSKSLGNGIDPIEVCQQYGTDALRLSLLLGISPGNDSRFYEEKVEGARNLVNKLWNISRYIMESSVVNDMVICKKLSLADQWILDKFNQLIIDVTDHFENYQFSLAGEKLRDFTWNDLADWYLEISKIEKAKDGILAYILQNLLKLWHPFIPFVTEQIYQNFFTQNPEDLLMVAQWPKPRKTAKISKTNELSFEVLKTLISQLRHLRAIYHISLDKAIPVIMAASNEADQKTLTDYSEIINRLAKVEIQGIQAKQKKPEQSAMIALGKIKVYLLIKDLIDINAEKKRLTADLEQTNSYVKNLKMKLNNKNFVKNAPQDIVAAEKAKLQSAESKIKQLNQYLKNLD